jgi:hypothetical protein
MGTQDGTHNARKEGPHDRKEAEPGRRHGGLHAPRVPQGQDAFRSQWSLRQPLQVSPTWGPAWSGT